MPAFVAGATSQSDPLLLLAASKRKGLWVGGPVPLGYRCIDKKLEIVPEEAEVVCTIFTRSGFMVCAPHHRREDLVQRQPDAT